MTNIGVLPALLAPPITSVSDYLKDKLTLKKSVVFSDEYNHASIIDGIKLSKAEKVVYRHRDLNQLESALKKYRRVRSKLIVTDGVFSMDGDIAPLDRIIELAREHGASVMVDDAHATGILGENGGGTMDYFKIKHSPDLIVMGTFTKVFGGVGGFVVGPETLIKYLRVTARTYIFSAPIPPAISAGLIESIKVVRQEPERRIRLWANINHLKNKLEEKGFNTLGSQTQIIPLYIGNEDTAICVSRRLLALGIFLPCVRWPAVAHGMARLRLTLMASHTKEQIDEFVNKLEAVRREIPF
jgi:7-keto-8-aminopelargonate synthetase-like enzyme